ncbi:OmpA family protein [Mesobacterium pallidum]|uniref:OmpA family protein n=1 Tax=Mesobacterium pallidum TaxID=2872037 RepID=UPI001EE31B6A|nr:OmpA family protein [Mesobacterium pallidum]
MRLSSLVYPAVAFLVAAVLFIFVASFSARLIEDSSVTGVRDALDREGLAWADADANGLQLFLIGTAPSEAERFQAVSVAGTVVDAARVIDQMNVAESEALVPPRFSIEILRNDSGISLIGLIPAGSGRDELLSAVGRLESEDNISDLLDVANYPVTKGWRDAQDYALRSLRSLPRAKISVESGRVAITAMAESPEDKAMLEAQLVRTLPDGVDLAMDISAPRPVITPFTLRFLMDAERGPRFDACAADTEEARERILAAARRVGLEGQAGCTIGLGVPSTRWAEAVEDTIVALNTLGGGSVTFSDADISLVALEGTAQDAFDSAIGELESRLPDVFALDAVLPQPPEQQAARGPAEFIAIRSPEGMVQLRGRVASDSARTTAESYAKARFGSDIVHMSARVDDMLPTGWQVRVLAAMEALSYLANGAVTVTPDSVTITGNTGIQDARAQIATLLADKLGEGQEFEIDVTYREVLDPISDQPTPEECENAIAAIVAERKINFEPGSATPDAEARAILDDIADVLKQCGQIRLEIQGYTDSQGRESMNLSLSQQRAQSVLNELRNRRVLTSSFTAKGYGEESPIADNGTEEGREANRRIEFHLVRPEPVADQQTTLESLAETAQEDAAAEDDGSSAEEPADEQN